MTSKESLKTLYEKYSGDDEFLEDDKLFSIIEKDLDTFEKALHELDAAQKTIYELRDELFYKIDSYTTFAEVITKCRHIVLQYQEEKYKREFLIHEEKD